MATKKAVENIISAVLVLLILGAVLFVTTHLKAPQKGAYCKVTKVYSSGEAREMAFYKNGKKIATQFFSQQGSLVREKGAHPQGTFKQLYPNGSLLSKDIYIDGLLSGARVVYHDGGVIQARESYKKGKLFGLRKVYSEKGKLACTQSFMNGKPEGLATLYSSDGKELLSLLYLNGRQEGPATLYYAPGHTAASWNYKRGVLSGEATLYYSDGKVLSKDIFRSSKLISRKMLAGGEPILSQTLKKYPRKKQVLQEGKAICILNYPVAEQKKLLARYKGKAFICGAFTFKAGGLMDGQLDVYYPSGKVLFTERYKNSVLIGRDVYTKKGELVYKESQE